MIKMDEYEILYFLKEWRDVLQDAVKLFGFVPGPVWCWQGHSRHLSETPPRADWVASVIPGGKLDAHTLKQFGCNSGKSLFCGSDLLMGIFGHTSWVLNACICMIFAVIFQALAKDSGVVYSMLAIPVWKGSGELSARTAEDTVAAEGEWPSLSLLLFGFSSTSFSCFCLVPFSSYLFFSNLCVS